MAQLFQLQHFINNRLVVEYDLYVNIMTILI